MPIHTKLDQLLVQRNLSLIDLSKQVGVTTVNLSILKTNKAKAIRFSTLASLCRVLKCQPSDILEYQNELLELPATTKKIEHSEVIGYFSVIGKPYQYTAQQMIDYIATYFKHKPTPAQAYDVWITGKIAPPSTES